MERGVDGEEGVYRSTILMAESSWARRADRRFRSWIWASEGRRGSISMLGVEVEDSGSKTAARILVSFLERFMDVILEIDWMMWTGDRDYYARGENL